MDISDEERKFRYVEWHTAGNAYELSDEYRAIEEVNHPRLKSGACEVSRRERNEKL